MSQSPAPFAPRAPKPNIPQTFAERQRALETVRQYVAETDPVPPLPLAQLREHADRIAQIPGNNPAWRDYLAVLLNNELWRETFAAVPYERRLLLLPKCLRPEARCPAPFDEFGLLCTQCGGCSIHDLQSEAEDLGYAVLVAEGSAVVLSLIQTRQVEAILGVSCLNVLEKAFPPMEAAAIPGVAVPLLQDDCRETSVDLNWVREYLHLSSGDTPHRLHLDTLRREIQTWFTPASLSLLLGEPEGATEQLAHHWLSRAGKRWRPFLATATCRALCGENTYSRPVDLQRIAIAVECFHKASLIHDDIEDNDSERYGAPTLHAEHGIAVALNIGDLLIGEGYRLIAATHFSADQKAAMFRVAANGQRQLCRGQGAELAWMHSATPSPLSSEQVLDIFRLKTAPAFEVALRLGALSVGCEEEAAIARALTAYSEALGIAYQIRDDLDDLQTDTARHLSILPTLAPQPSLAEEKARQLLASYQEQAIQTLRNLENPALKGLLRRLIAKIFNEPSIPGWCHEVQDKRAETEIKP